MSFQICDAFNTRPSWTKRFFSPHCHSKFMVPQLNFCNQHICYQQEITVSRICHMNLQRWIVTTHGMVSKHMMHAKMNAPIHGTLMAFPAAFTKAFVSTPRVSNFGDPEALACFPVVGMQWEVSISSGVRKRRCTSVFQSRLISTRVFSD